MRPQSLDRARERLVPGRDAQAPAIADERIGESLVGHGGYYSEMILKIALALFVQDVDGAVGKVVKPDGPGCAVLVMKEGKVVHKKGYGLANLEHRVPITSETVFDLASVSKQFTAMTVMILHDRGDLSIDDDIRKHLTEFPEHDPKRPIRIRDLLNQVSGIKDYLNLLGKHKGDVNRLKNEGVLKLLLDEKLAFPTGTKWAYSNSNYCLLALIVERKTGKSFREVITKEIFEPLGMKRARVFDDATQVIPNRAYGYGKRRGEWTYQHSDLIMTGDGAVMLSLEDFALWDPAKLVKKETLELAWTAGKLDDGKEHRYGFGWAVGKGIVEHAGGWVGFRTYIVRYRETGLTVVVLANSNELDAAKLGREVAELYK